MYLSRGPRLARMLSTASHEVFDVAVVGAGVVGAALACALKCEAHPTAPSQGRESTRLVGSYARPAGLREGASAGWVRGDPPPVVNRNPTRDLCGSLSTIPPPSYASTQASPTSMDLSFRGSSTFSHPSIRVARLPPTTASPTTVSPTTSPAASLPQHLPPSLTPPLRHPGAESVAGWRRTCAWPSSTACRCRPRQTPPAPRRMCPVRA
jgi:hypothetical protein